VNFQGIDFWFIAINIIVILFSLSIHESAHAWMAEQFGDPTGRQLGRVTLNPLAHIDPVGTVLVPIVLSLAGGVVFGWAKPVPVNFANLKEPRKANIFISAAGPVSNLLAAVGFLVIGKVVAAGIESTPGGPLSALQPLLLVCYLGLLLNIVLAVFNLIPIPPLDGSWVLGGLFPDTFGQLINRIRPYGFLLLLLLLYTGALDYIWRPVLGFVRYVAF
jgi:Zn-dependent protease